MIDDYDAISDIRVWEVAVRSDSNDEVTAWRATIDGDSDVPTCGGDNPTDAVDVLFDVIREDHESPLLNRDTTNSEEDDR